MLRLGFGDVTRALQAHPHAGEEPVKLTPLASAIALLSLSAAALAQPATPQRVEITGSSIKRIASEGALPIQVISRQDMERQGIVTAEQLINSTARTAVDWTTWRRTPTWWPVRPAAATVCRPPTCAAKVRPARWCC
jgi:hypothetical protein